ncbi:MAG TPA: FtsX-like permease family protein [Sandaracinaceae bacterium LLY-WYZ-13_1]|nr:FtsX-like permease family protein [Sandaracinaceae bacterium LLY-WYZ-13_1]
MRTDLFLALRFLREGRSQTALIAVGVTLGSAVVVFLTGLLDGLQDSLIERTLGIQAHVVVHPPREAPRPLVEPGEGEVVLRRRVEAEQRLRSIAGWAGLVRRVEAIPGVAAVSPIVTGPAMAVRGRADRAVVVLSGFEDRFDRVIPLAGRMVSGRYRLRGNDALVGVELADDLGVGVGDVLRLRPGDGAGQRFRVRGVFDLGNKDVNRRWVVLPLRGGQTLLGLRGGVSDVHVRVEDVFEADRVASRIASDSGLEADSWMQTNQQLLVGLEGQSSSGNLITFFVILAVALGISSVLVVSVVQKSGEIGILRAAGASRGLVMRVFLWQGAILGFFGSLGGCAVGIGLGAFFESLAVNPDGTPKFPVAQPTALMVGTVVGAVVVGLVAAVWPARRAARLDPVVAIRSV